VISKQALGLHFGCLSLPPSSAVLLIGPLGYGSTHVPAVGRGVGGRYQAAELRPNTGRPTLTFRKSVNFQSIQLGRLEAHLKSDFPGSPVVRTLLPLQEAQVRFLVRKLKIPHTGQHTAHPSGPAKKLI